jgi:hypothetical protein
MRSCRHPGWKRHNVTEIRIKRGEFEADLNSWRQSHNALNRQIAFEG